MTQKIDSQNKTMLLGIGALAIAVLLIVSGFLGQEPGRLQGNLDYRPSDKITVFYWAVLFYSHVNLPLAVIILLLVSILVFRLLEELKQKIFSFATLAAIVLSVLAAAIPWFSVLFFGEYEHATSAKFGWDRYNLGVSKAMDGDNFYVVGKCDTIGIICDCYAVAPVIHNYHEKPSRVLNLEQDAKTKVIYIKYQNKRIPISK
ncbi:MAG: hypothetical protein JGK17_10060 [Microcoleus sp. PH2017_10_PVI_O_A]|uniref:hypothetical protein n=1 Tax=unclassified Microcoleus TaxID=2642155 RepID=UPI001DC03A33|nr:MULTISPECIES: hypothetical protein [unclassified Microcoleus]TAE83724.1 MAG: hypothetical protein EAZ83_08360 [Oscillatoriales cyanobacterium]MCC3405915.1 hypothetical protein [Microcoleus sp. PH2017_10_PVI_O_A]MCC3459994.1 hypothetical protein [Microcoleus sp. PH2017_11_PCY_U_A]MCC3478508.1 hypothetical protein [Microcoleus sp. PH2017_12_PCY_D_A]MCC3559360.1 hypothetical protein [Microcoleus sp. PH2017_27_LUM_O_A]